MMTPPKGLDAQNVLADADLCVKCGLCLPQCPTYGLTQNEADSPRGRIAQVQGLYSGLISRGAGVASHLDGCLSCRRCEVVCPANVPYSRILDAGRARLAEGQPARTRTTRVLAFFLISPAGRLFTRLFLSVYRRSGLQFLLRKSRLLGRGRLARLESLLPRIQRWPAGKVLETDERVSSPKRQRIGLFRGCVSSLLEQDSITAMERLLNAAGYQTVAVSAQTCCGALHQHSGLLEPAKRLARINVSAFAGLDGIASGTSGCAASLRDYADLLPAEGAVFAARVKDFSQWILPKADALQFHALPLRAALHVPCTARNVLGSDGALRQLLERIPQLELLELDAAQSCCGAAGSHFLSHPEQADRLLAPKLKTIASLRPDIVISANIGCSMHLAAGLVRTNSLEEVPPVLHPAQVLAAALCASVSRS